MPKKRKSAAHELREMANDLQWYEPADPTPRHLCPCCDYVTLSERGHYLICPVCFWEDDGQDLDSLDQESGPNHGITLRKGRANFKKFGACEEAMVQNVVSIADRNRFEYRPRVTPKKQPGAAKG
jgi:hypothetical protein